MTMAKGIVYLVGAGPGDPGLLTLRGAELLRRAGVVVYDAGIPLTHRDFASRVTLITGHGDPEKEETAIDWASVAKTPGTQVVMMGTDRIGQIAQTLMNHGMAADTPIAMIRWGTTGRQQSIEGTLANIGEVASREKISPPTVAVIGEVVKLAGRLN